MAIKETTRYETTDGTLYTSEKEAQRAQDALNNTDRKNFRLKTWKDFVNEQLNEGSEEIQKIYGNLTRGNYGVAQSQGIFERLWLGTITDVKVNQREVYGKMLTTIIGEDEAHIKADGVYDFVIGLGAKALMTRSKEQPYSLSTGYDGETYTLQASPGGFRMTNSKGAIGTSTFIDNRWTVVFKEVTHVVRWQAAMGK
jgi:hypothetical protein